MSDELRFGLVGCGVISQTHGDALRQIPGAKLVACCDIVKDKACLFAKRYDINAEQTYTDFVELLKDSGIDAVIVCTPSGTHATIGVQCLEAGKPALLEKPMDVSVAAIDQLLAAQKISGLALGVISQHRFDEASILAETLVSSGELGKIVLAEAHIKWYRTQEYYDAGDWRGTWLLDGGGALMNQGVHTVDLMRWILGPVKSIYAVARTSGHVRIEVEDVICATVTFMSGAVGTIVASTAAYPGFPAELSIHGLRGSIVISGDVVKSVELAEGSEASDTLRATVNASSAPDALRVAQGGTRAAEASKLLAPTSAGTTWGDAHRAQLIDFIAAVKAKRAPLVDGHAGRSSVELILAAYESARTGQAVYFT